MDYLGKHSNDLLKEIKGLNSGNRKKDAIVSARINDETDAMKALKHDSLMSRSLQEAELVEQRLGFDPAIQGSILNYI